LPAVEVRSQTGSPSGTIELDPAIFEVQPNIPVIHQVVTAQRAAARSGTHSTLTRAEVRGGGKKPWRQKGTGRARQGSIRAPQWSGGGVAFGPKPRNYAQKTPKKMIQLALRGALSDRAADNKIAVVDAWEFPQPKTKDASAALDALGLSGRILIVLSRDDEVAFKSFRNLTDVQIILVEELNPYDILCNDWVLFTRATLPGGKSEAPPVTVEPAVQVASDAITASEGGDGA
jgi:large subunit ribosomal protein L4